MNYGNSERPLMASRRGEVKLYKTVQAAFSKDCEKLLKQFGKLKTFSFPEFAKIWKDMAFSLVFSGKSCSDEFRHYTEVFLFEAKKYYLFAKDIYIKTGALYLMYGIYYKQPIKTYVKVRVTKDEFAKILDYVKEMKELKQMHPLYVYCKMMVEDVFDFVYNQQVIAPDLRHFQVNFVMEDNTFKKDPVESIENSLDNLLENKDISLINTEYRKALAEYAENNKSSKLMMFKNNILDDIKSIVEQSKSGEIESSVGSSTSKEQEESIGTKRALLKQRAMEKKIVARKYEVE